MSAIPSLTLFTNYYYYYGFSYVEEKHVFSGAALSMEALHIVSCAKYTKAPFFLFNLFFLNRNRKKGKKNSLARLRCINFD